MEFINRYKSSIWRVPLISLLAGFFYLPLYARIVIRFGTIEPGVLNDRICLLTSAVLFLAILFLGGFLLLRNQTRKEIFVSALVVVLYGIVLVLIQWMTGSTTGPAAVVFLYLNRPLEWTFSGHLASFLFNHCGLNVLWIGFFGYFEPLLFVLFGKKQGR